MLLSPRERVVRSISDTWTKLWEHTSCRHHQRFSLTDVVDKLMVSLDTYKVSFVFDTFPVIHMRYLVSVDYDLNYIERKQYR